MRQALATSAIGIAALMPFAASGADGWLADPRTGCRAFVRAIEPGASVKWEGTCVAGAVNGRGTLQYILAGKVTSTIEGEFRAGKREGRALVVAADGTRFEGEYRDGLPNGRGITLWPDGDRYDGNFVAGERTGHGVFTWKSGSRYEGEFLNGDRSGRGKYVNDEGSYEGEWANDKRNGRGIELWTSGGRYEGEFKDGKPDGRGTYRGVARDGTTATWSGMWEAGCYSANGRTAAVLTTRKACGFE